LPLPPEEEKVELPFKLSINHARRLKSKVIVVTFLVGGSDDQLEQIANSESASKPVSYAQTGLNLQSRRERLILTTKIWLY
jgi:hypothetical protein